MEIGPVPDGNTGNLVAALKKDDLRSLFYLFAGKPDSKIRVFTESVKVVPQDLIALNEAIARKLATHAIEAVIVTAKVSFEGSLLAEFGTWAEFAQHHWAEAEKVEEVVLKWDFMVRVDGYANPQRHTLLFRVSRDIKPSHFFQLISAANSDDLEDLDMISAPAFCRVDFINVQMSKELINEVADWYKCLPAPSLIPSRWYRFKRHRKRVGKVLEHWALLSWAGLASAAMLWASRYWYQGKPPVDLAAITLFLAIYSLRPAASAAAKAGEHVFKRLGKLEGARVLFEFTRADKKAISDSVAENNASGTAFFWSATWNIALNLIAPAIYTVMFARILSS